MLIILWDFFTNDCQYFVVIFFCNLFSWTTFLLLPSYPFRLCLACQSRVLLQARSERGVGGRRRRGGGRRAHSPAAAHSRRRRHSRRPHSRYEEGKSCQLLQYHILYNAVRIAPYYHFYTTLHIL